LDSNKNIFVFDTIFFNKYVVRKRELISIIGIDFNPYRSEIAILYDNKLIELIDFKLDTEKTINLSNKININNYYKIIFLNDPNSIAIISKNKILIIDLNDKKPIASFAPKLDYIEDAEYKTNENYLYLYQQDKNIKKFYYELVDLIDMRSEIIISDSMAGISRKNNLMISFKLIDKIPIFKIINLDPEIFLFNWADLPGHNNYLLKNFLNDDYKLDLNDIEINKSYDGMSINVFNYDKRHLAEIKVDKSKEYALLKIDEWTEELMISIEEGEQKIYKKILKESHNISLSLEEPDDNIKARYSPILLFSRDGKILYISDYSGNLIMWDWIKEPTIIEKESRYWYRTEEKTMLESRYINQNLFKCKQMNLRNASGIPEENIQELIKLGAVI
jgi:hypothetical protein